ncbi:MAG: hypothetical protein RL272_504 [Candidatus Parcubacteria bacterium]|jgi:predicted alpha/beta hydrolase family esterase
MKKVLIIHGLGGKPNGGWRPWLMGELGRAGIFAYALAMPDPDEPVLDAWVGEIRHAVALHPDDEIILVGHSLGVAAILRYLEREGGRKVQGAVLIAGPSAPSTSEKARTFLDKPFAYGRIREKLGRCVLIYGDRDEIVPPSHAEAHARGLDAPVIMVKGVGHFNSSSGCFALPECLEAVLDMIR